MTRPTEGIGCRDAAISTAFLLCLGVVFFAVGLTMINRDPCTGLCEGAGLTLLYAGGPISALIGVVTEAVIVAWPLDLILWVVLGFGVARLAARRGMGTWRLSLAVVLFFLAYGLVLSRIVELAV